MGIGAVLGLARSALTSPAPGDATASCSVRSRSAQGMTSVPSGAAVKVVWVG